MLHTAPCGAWLSLEKKWQGTGRADRIELSILAHAEHISLAEETETFVLGLKLLRRTLPGLARVDPPPIMNARTPNRGSGLWCIKDQVAKNGRRFGL